MSATVKIPSHILKAKYFHTLGITGKNITVAILDSGLAPHPDFSGKTIPVTKDFIHYRSYPYDDCGHGTHVAGILASEKIGIAPEATLIPIKILDENGDGSVEGFTESMKWLLRYHEHYHIRIVNISIGTTKKEYQGADSILNKWVNRLWQAGLIICCSAGNNGPAVNSITAPGNCEKVITVGAYDGKGFSSAGELSPFITKPEIVAPGYHILSTKPYSGYQIKNGTSMSVPFVSGAIALLLQLNPELTNEEIKYHLMNTAKPAGRLPSYMQGAGRLNLQQFLQDYL